MRQLEARLAAGGRWLDGGFVFASSIGTPLEPRNVTRQFKALLTAASLPNIRLHDLRHSCATLLLAPGVNPRVVMETLGHSQVSLTLNTDSPRAAGAATRRRGPDGRGLRQVVTVSVSVSVNGRIRPRSAREDSPIF